MTNTSTDKIYEGQSRHPRLHVPRTTAQHIDRASAEVQTNGYDSIACFLSSWFCCFPQFYGIASVNLPCFSFCPFFLDLLSFAFVQRPTFINVHTPRDTRVYECISHRCAFVHTIYIYRYRRISGSLHSAHVHCSLCIQISGV